MNEAALFGILSIINKANRENREYGGFVYKDPTDNKYYYTEGIPGTNTIEICKFNRPPKGYEPIAIYHVHYGTGYNVYKFGTFDTLNSSRFHMPVYLGVWDDGLKMKSWDWNAKENERQIIPPKIR